MSARKSVDDSIGDRRAKRQLEFAHDLADGILAGLRRSALARGEELRDVDVAAWRKRVAAIVGDAAHEDAGQGSVATLADRRRGRTSVTPESEAPLRKLQGAFDGQ